MLTIGLAAGIFKPLISGTVRAVTDKSNKTLGFGIFYAMVNVGGSFGPIVAGKLRAISWDYAFFAAAASIVLMLLITIFFYKEPEREIEGASLGEKLREIGTALSDLKFSVFLLLLGLFFYLVMTPMGVIMRLGGKDFLHERIDRSAASYWIKREDKEFNRDRYRRLF